MDSYSTIAAIACDPTVGRRVTACLAQLGHDDAEALAWAWRWRLAAQPGWAAAWDSATASAQDAITDGMILAGVRAVGL